MSDNVIVSIISLIGGIVVTYIPLRYSSQTVKPKNKNRIDTAFDMYESMLKQLNNEIKRKDAIIEALDKEISRLKSLEENI